MQEFAELHESVNGWSMTDEQIDKAEQDCIAWVRQYKTLHGAESVKPYLHAAVFHLFRMARKWGGIGKFNNQGVEGKNGQQTKECRRNVTYGQACLQIVEREHRMLLAREEGLLRVARPYRAWGRKAAK